MSYNISGSDITIGLVPKSTFFDLYPSLTNVIASPALWCWGDNSSGQLGDNTSTNRSSPVQTKAGGTNWKQTASGGSLAAGIKTDGTLWVWGDNSSGQLGDNTSTNRSSPVQTIAGGTTWKQVTVEAFTISAIKTDGTLWSWGFNQQGELGDNTLTSRSSPVQTIAGGTTWKQVSAGFHFTCAIKTDGTLWTWGNGGVGQLGNNSTSILSSPVQTVSGGTNWKQVSAGDRSVLAIKTDGTLWAWGNNSFGILGNNSLSHMSSPVQTVAGGTNWKSVFSGGYHSSGIKTDGTLWTWGNNSYGQLGDNTITQRLSPVQTISGGTNWKQVANGDSFSCGIKSDGTLWTWGLNTSGQLGNNSTTNISSPVQTIAGGTNWKQCSASFYNMYAIAEDDINL